MSNDWLAGCFIMAELFSVILAIAAMAFVVALLEDVGVFSFDGFFEFFN